MLFYMLSDKASASSLEAEMFQELLFSYKLRVEGALEFRGNFLQFLAWEIRVCFHFLFC